MRCQFLYTCFQFRTLVASRQLLSGSNFGSWPPLQMWQRKYTVQIAHLASLYFTTLYFATIYFDTLSVFHTRTHTSCFTCSSNCTQILYCKVDTGWTLVHLRPFKGNGSGQSQLCCHMFQLDFSLAN